MFTEISAREAVVMTAAAATAVTVGTLLSLPGGLLTHHIAVTVDSDFIELTEHAFEGGKCVIHPLDVHVLHSEVNDHRR